jgi:hypothetical protein
MRNGVKIEYFSLTLFTDHCEVADDLYPLRSMSAIGFRDAARPDLPNTLLISS